MISSFCFAFLLLKLMPIFFPNTRYGAIRLIYNSCSDDIYFFFVSTTYFFSFYPGLKLSKLVKEPKPPLTCLNLKEVILVVRYVVSSYPPYLAFYVLF